MTASIKGKVLAKQLAISLGTGLLAALINKNGIKSFGSMAKPVFTPPNWVFFVVWTALYLLMAISAYMVETTPAKKTERRRALTVYYVQLFFNFAWCFFFFTMTQYLFSFIWLIALWVLVLAMTALFSRINKTAGLLQIPYCIWVAFAAVLNAAIWLMNK